MQAVQRGKRVAGKVGGKLRGKVRMGCGICGAYEKNVVDKGGKRCQRTEKRRGNAYCLTGIFVTGSAVIKAEQERAQHIGKQYAEGKGKAAAGGDDLSPQQGACGGTEKQT